MIPLEINWSIDVFSVCCNYSGTREEYTWQMENKDEQNPYQGRYTLGNVIYSEQII